MFHKNLYCFNIRLNFCRQKSEKSTGKNLFPILKILIIFGMFYIIYKCIKDLFYAG